MRVPPCTGPSRFRSPIRAAWLEGWNFFFMALERLWAARAKGATGRERLECQLNSWWSQSIAWKICERYVQKRDETLVLEAEV